MIHPNSQKTSFNIRLPHDPKSNCNKFITKGYSLCVCLLNITIKVGLSLGIILILFSQIHPGEMINEINKKTDELEYFVSRNLEQIVI